MALKNTVLEGVGRILQSDQAAKLLQNEALMNAVMKAFSLSGEARSLIDERLGAMIKTLNLVTRDEVRGLQRALERLERELGDLQQRVDEATARAADAEEAAQTAARAADQARLKAESLEKSAATAAKPKRAPRATGTKASTGTKAGGAKAAPRRSAKKTGA